jgi:hypothetical protein
MLYLCAWRLPGTELYQSLFVLRMNEWKVEKENGRSFLVAASCQQLRAPLESHGSGCALTRHSGESCCLASYRQKKHRGDHSLLAGRREPGRAGSSCVSIFIYSVHYTLWPGTCLTNDNSISRLLPKRHSSSVISVSGMPMFKTWHIAYLSVTSASHSALLCFAFLICKMRTLTVVSLL